MKKFICFITTIVMLSCALCFILTGCASDENAEQLDKPTQNLITYHFNETINNIDWSVTYYKGTNDILSISASYTEKDSTSEFYKFSAYYHGDHTMYVNHNLFLSGTPLEDDWFLIEQREQYVMPYMDADDWTRIKRTYPSCTFIEASGYIVLYEKTTRYEEKLIFSNFPPLNQ